MFKFSLPRSISVLNENVYGWLFIFQWQINCLIQDQSFQRPQRFFMLIVYCQASTLYLMIQKSKKKMKKKVHFKTSKSVDQERCNIHLTVLLTELKNIFIKIHSY